MPYLIVFLGAGIGGAARHAVNTAAVRMMGYGFPWGTLTVNILGSIVMGLLTELFVVRTGLPQEVRLFMTTGLLGGFTTFSDDFLLADAVVGKGTQRLAKRIQRTGADIAIDDADRAEQKDEELAVVALLVWMGGDRWGHDGFRRKTECTAKDLRSPSVIKSQP